ncbi:MAG: hypothetical protein LUH40_01585 [Clostridiales bacterium]|nr:hypothetical protein [Clostridiales bacterium]
MRKKFKITACLMAIVLMLTIMTPLTAMAETPSGDIPIGASYGNALDEDEIIGSYDDIELRPVVTDGSVLNITDSMFEQTITVDGITYTLSAFGIDIWDESLEDYVLYFTDEITFISELINDEDTLLAYWDELGRYIEWSYLSDGISLIYTSYTEPTTEDEPTASTGSDSDDDFRCKMCWLYEATMDIPYIGLLITFIHMWVHMAHYIGYIT